MSRLLATLIMYLALSSFGVSQPWQCNSTLYIHVSSNVGSSHYTVADHNLTPYDEIRIIALDVADRIIDNANLPITLIEDPTGSLNPRITVQWGVFSQDSAVAMTDQVGNNEVITVNANGVFHFTPNPNDSRSSLAGIPHPKPNVDIESVLLHEFCHALGLAPGGAGGTILACSYHGTNRVVDPASANTIRSWYSACGGADPREYILVEDRLKLPSGDLTNVGKFKTNWPHPIANPMSIRLTKNSGTYAIWRPNDPNYPYHLEVPIIEAIDNQVIAGCKTAKEGFRLPTFSPEIWDRDPDPLWQPLPSYAGSVVEIVYQPKYDVIVVGGETCEGAPVTVELYVASQPVSLPYNAEYKWTDVEAPLSITVGLPPGPTGYAFVGWKDQNGLIISQNITLTIKPTRNLTLTPLFKLQNISTTALSELVSESPTSVNSQRKITSIDYGGGTVVLHQVYTSCYGIYYSYSTDGGANWSIEHNVAIAWQSGMHKNPSLFVDMDTVWVTWNDNGTLSLVKFLFSDPYNTKYVYSTFSCDPPASNFAPVVIRTSASNTSDVVVFYETEANDIKYALFKNNTLCNTQSCLSGIRADLPEMPSAAITGNDEIEVVWRERYDLYYRKGSIALVNSVLSLHFPASEEKVELGGRDAVGAPSIAPNDFTGANGLGSAIAVETELIGGGFSGVSVTMRQFAGWSNPQVFVPVSESGRMWAPSVSLVNIQPYFNAMENLRFGCNYTDLNAVPPIRQVHFVKAFPYMGQIIYSLKNLTPAVDALHPSVVQQPTFLGGMTVYTELGAGQLNPIETTPQGFNRTTTTSLFHTKELHITKDTTTFLLGLGNLRLVLGGSSQSIDWAYKSDTTVLGVTRSTAEEYKTVPFSCSAGSKLMFVTKEERRGGNLYPSTLEIRLQVINASNNTVLGEAILSQPASLLQNKKLKNVMINLSPFSGNSVYLRTYITNSDSSLSYVGCDVWMYAAADTVYFPKDGQTASEVEVVEYGFNDLKLFQNWPNPFNPSTSIEFFIPLAGRVSLSIYDISGNERAVLCNGYLEAGQHSYEFDSGDFQSGTYLYRLTTEYGYLTKRMTLVK